jgi:hypothetical protein
VQRDEIISLSIVLEKKQVCQIKCTERGCNNAFDECVRADGCTGISLNAQQTWGTLKFSFNWWKATDVEYAGTNWDVCQETFRKMQGFRSSSEHQGCTGLACGTNHDLRDVANGWHVHFCADLVHGEYAPKV